MKPVRRWAIALATTALLACGAAEEKLGDLPGEDTGATQTEDTGASDATGDTGGSETDATGTDETGTDGGECIEGELGICTSPYNIELCEGGVWVDRPCYVVCQQQGCMGGMGCDQMQNTCMCTGC